MGKIEQKLLEDFKKSNKTRKEKLAKKFGFESTNEYESYLLKTEVEDKVESNLEEEVLTDIVIAFDTTGSMSMYIEAVKRHVTELIPSLFANTKNLKISIVAFGDYCDMDSEKSFGNAYQTINLTDNVNSLIKFVQNAYNTYGGDAEEFYELVLQKIRLETSWRKGSNKSILLIADDDPHELGYTYKKYVVHNKIDWKNEAKELAKLGIKVDTLACTGKKWYRKLSEITKGIYLLFSSSTKTKTLLEGYTYARSGSTTAFATTCSTVTASGDAELIGVFKQLGEL